MNERQTFRLPAPVGGWGQPWPDLFEIAAELPTQGWMLIGGLMVQAHTLAAGIDAIRPTKDVDVLVLVHQNPDPLTATISRLRELGYRDHKSIDSSAPAHRFFRGESVVDLGLADNLGPNLMNNRRLGGRPLLAIPGGQQATKRLANLEVQGCRTRILIPDQLGALVLKGAAYIIDSRDKARHLQDAAALAATITDHERDRARLTGNDPKRIRALSDNLQSPTHPAWLSLDPRSRIAGQDTLRLLLLERQPHLSPLSAKERFQQPE